MLRLRHTTDGAHAEGPPAVLLGERSGAFAEWDWDGRRLTAATDRLGLFPLHYRARPDGITVSPSVLQLVDGPAELDEPAMAAFLRLGYFLGEDTPFAEIRAVPPGGRLTWAGGRLAVSGDRPVVEPLSISRTDAIDRYVELVRAAVDRQPHHSRTAIALSGGVDSRHLLLELCRAGRPPALSVTMRYFHPRSNQDARTATLVAAAAGVPHEVLDPPRSLVRTELAKHRATGFATDEMSWVVPLARSLRGRVDFVYDGLGGDLLAGGLWQQPTRLALFAAGTFERLAEHYFDTTKTTLREPQLARLLSPRGYRRLGRGVAVERLVAELRRHVDAADPNRSFVFWNRTRRETGLRAYQVLSAVATVRTPYLDSDLYELLASLPAATVGEGFHVDAVARAFPRRPALPYVARWGVRPGGRGEGRRAALEGLAYLAAGPNPLLRTSYLLLRLAERAVTGRPGGPRGALALYLAHLGRVAR